MARLDTFRTPGYNPPGLQTKNGIGDVAGNYPSSGGIGESGAWFYDSEGNFLAIGQPIYRVESCVRAPTYLLKAPIALP